MNNLIKHSLEAAKLEFKEEPMDDYYNNFLAGYPSRIRVKKILDKLGDLTGKNVLDVGCEAGYVSLKILQKKPKLICAVDICEEALDSFKRKLQNKRFKSEIVLKKAFMHELPFKNNFFDKVICTEVIEHVPNISEGLQEIKRVMKPKAELIITFPNEKLRKFVYPIAKLLGMNTDVEKQVTLFNYKLKDILLKLGQSFKIKKIRTIPFIFPITNFIICEK